MSPHPSWASCCKKPRHPPQCAIDHTFHSHDVYFLSVTCYPVGRPVTFSGHKEEGSYGASPSCHDSEKLCFFLPSPETEEDSIACDLSSISLKFGKTRDPIKAGTDRSILAFYQNTGFIQQGRSACSHMTLVAKRGHVWRCGPVRSVDFYDPLCLSASESSLSLFPLTVWIEELDVEQSNRPMTRRRQDRQ